MLDIKDRFLKNVTIVIFMQGFLAQGVALLAVLLALVLTDACGGSSPSTPSTPTTPSPTLKTEAFTGTVAVNGMDFHPFNLSQRGELDVTLTTLTVAGQPSTIIMGLGIGVPVGSNCTVFASTSTTTAAGAAAQLVGTADAGVWCVQVYDVGNQTSPVVYAVSVVHP